MVTCEKLSRRPQAAPSLIGMTLEAFDKLFAEFAAAHAQRLANLTVARRKGAPRQRAVGAGGKHRYSRRDRLLMTLFWRRVYTTYEVMGFFYGLDKTNIEDRLKDVLATLDTMTTFTYHRPGPERKKLRSAGEVMDAFPKVHLVVEAKEQRIERPKAGKDGQGEPQDRQRPYSSGKKKAHTLKNQIAVRHKRFYLPFKARRHHPLTEEQKAYNRLLARFSIVVEHTLACMSRFQVLRQVYRHRRSEHSRVVWIVAGLVDRRIAARPLKVYADAGA